MVSSEPETERASASKKMLVLLEGLKRTPVGTVIYDQIARLAEEQQGVQAKVDYAYAALQHMLLDVYARDPSAEQITRINARLIQLRRGASDSVSVAVTPAALEEKIRKTAAAPAAASSRVGGETKAPGSAPAATSATAPSASPASMPPATQNNALQAERRVNSAYRQHLDHQRNEIEKLQDALAKSVTEAVTQNREFGALLQIELRALQQAEGEKEIEQLRQILVGGLEELITGQHSLDSKLHRTGGYLSLIKADSERLRDELNKVRLLSLTDEFTGLPNRRAFMRRLQDEISRAQRYGSPLALAMIDLDEFKAINDVHGHAAGDAILRCYSCEALTVLRHHDLVARYGGEEFAVLLPNTSQRGATAAITKVQARAREIKCEYQDKMFPLPTFSTGIALYSQSETYTDLIDRADRALYRAKRLGRNRIELELTIPPPTKPQGMTNGKGA
ncbi:MAG: GGDEF domain-containing protein [Sulfuricaulis sp.]